VEWPTVLRFPDSPDDHPAIRNQKALTPRPSAPGIELVSTLSHQD
jgi:hypothetical protein